MLGVANPVGRSSSVFRLPQRPQPYLCALGAFGPCSAVASSGPTTATYVLA